MWGVLGLKMLSVVGFFDGALVWRVLPWWWVGEEARGDNSGGEARGLAVVVVGSGTAVDTVSSLVAVGLNFRPKLYYKICFLWGYI